MNPLCVHWLGQEKERDLEASLAVDPLDPSRVLVAWTVRERGEVFSNAWIMAALTEDGGRSWVTSPLHDPSVPDLPLARRYSFDERAAFAPDGTALVLYGGEMERYGTVADGVSRITLASLPRGATTWAYQRVAEMPGVTWDFFGFAVAPDSGHLFVATDELVSGGVWFWRSLDKGASWEGPTSVYASRGAPHGLHVVPTLAAGDAGLVVLVTQAALDKDLGENAAGIAALVSHDDGASFGAQTMVAGSTNAGLVSFPVAVTRGAAPKVDVLVSDGTSVLVVESLDQGGTWAAPVTMGPAGPGKPKWAALATTPDGRIDALVRSDDPRTGWSMAFLSRSPAGSIASLLLGAAPRIPNAGAAGEDYGGLAVAIDAVVWAAFSDPRAGPTEGIGVVRLARNP